MHKNKKVETLHKNQEAKALYKHKKWCICTLAGTIALLIFFASAVIIVDPFFHYHKPFDKIPYALYNQSYQNPGIVRHFEYDSLITGTSMVENFKTTDFMEILGANAIKVPYSGGTSKNMNIILKKALKSNPDLKTVYLGLDLYMLKREPDETRNPLPMYLYDTNPFNDVQYLLNKDVSKQLLDSVNRALDGIRSMSFDDYSYWQNSFIFSQYAVAGPYFDSKKRNDDNLSLNDSVDLAEKNLLQNIVPLIDTYPDVEFVIFYSPYSILYWYFNYSENELARLEYSIQTLIQYDNVKLFLFQNNTDVVTNLYNYKDYTHFSADINKYMVDCFANGNHQLTIENYKSELDKMKDLVENFDYGILIGDANIFIREDDFINYLTKLNNSRYISFITARDSLPLAISSSLESKFTQLELSNITDSSGYAAIINGSNILFQESADEAIQFNDNIYGLSINLISEKRNNNYIEVSIDNIIYTTNQDGINIVVYDKKLQRVMDNIAININDNKIIRQ